MILAATAVLAHLLALPNQALRIPASAPNPAAVSAAASAVTEPLKPPAAIGVTPSVSGTEATLDVPASDNDTDKSLTAAAGASVYARITPATIGESGTAVAPIILAPTIQDNEKEHRWEQRQKKIWLALSVTQSAAAAFDGWSTRRVISSGVGVERDPVLRPFAGNDSLYAVMQIVPIGLDYVSYRLISNHHGWIRHLWLLPQAIATAASLGAGANNLAVLNAH